MFSFGLNNMNYTVEEKPYVEIKEVLEKDGAEYEGSFLFGACSFTDKRILINNTLCEKEKLHTLRHELTHAYLYEMGFNSVGNYTEEMVCDIVAACSWFVETSAQNYKKTREEI